MSHPTAAPASCQLRALPAGVHGARLVTRNLSFGADRQLGLDPGSELPAALDLLVGALAADLLIGLSREASRAGTPLHEAELRLEAHLGNPLVALGVVGETGSPALQRVQGTLFLSADLDVEAMHTLWVRTCAHAAVFATVQRTAIIDITLRLVP